ncbi:MAG: hypothetical protein R3E12_19450 [Candidatus Eisenbacteria bacterium]|uniref:FeoB-associated Cys-rich membrane protein n=1 Tax=Eiseniibacteriota bacterium TaxID=2212470 RepID=A0A956RP49_UNCEI|nr:hypothetical protein [Candidatus Eisenbacteria bacterium]
MNGIWQLIIAAVIVGLAVAYLARSAMRQLSGKGEAGCDRCGPLEKPRPRSDLKEAARQTNRR